MIIDAHTHYGPWYFPVENLDWEGFKRRLSGVGIEGAIISSSSAIVYDFREGNAELARLLIGESHYWGYVTVNFNYPEESLEELDRYLQDPQSSRFVGIKVHPLLAAKSFDCPEGERIVEHSIRYQAPFLIHTFNSPLESPRNVLRLSKAYPQALFILGHMGGYEWEVGIEVAKERPNVYLEVCSTCTDPRKLRQAVEAIGPQRVLFGTDATLFEPSYMRKALEDAGLSRQEMRWVTGESARNLFRLERWD
jgi:hypothetical protein